MGSKVMLIDDDKLLAKIVVAHLSSIGYVVEIANNGLEAVDKI